MIALTGLCLLPLLSGCTSTPAAYMTVSYPAIPAPLLADCLPPVIATQMSWGEMLILNEVLLTVIEQCNLDKQAIRAIERERRHEKTC
ncbi:Rz1-like lysis system protein LysC [Arsenophonus nasoniae]